MRSMADAGGAVIKACQNYLYKIACSWSKSLHNFDENMIIQACHIP